MPWASSDPEAALLCDDQEQGPTPLDLFVALGSWRVGENAGKLHDLSRMCFQNLSPSEVVAGLLERTGSDLGAAAWKESLPGQRQLTFAPVTVPFPEGAVRGSALSRTVHRETLGVGRGDPRPHWQTGRQQVRVGWCVGDPGVSPSPASWQLVPEAAT